MNRTSPDRIREIDVLRGVALILMIFFHLLFDLKEIYNYPVAYNEGLYYYIGKVSAVLFIMISAASCSFSRSNLKRALKFLGVAAIITVATHLYNPNFGVKFGILHFLGVSILLYPVFRDVNRYILVLLGTLMIILGRLFGTITALKNYLFLLNVTNSDWSSADYYPLLPWLGVFLYGISAGKFLYREKRGIFNVSSRLNAIGFLGRHTLLIYLIHQPVLILFIKVYRKITG